MSLLLPKQLSGVTPDYGKGTSDNEDVVLLQPELLAIQVLEGVQLEGPEKNILREIR